MHLAEAENKEANATTQPGSRPGALRGGVAAKARDHLPYMRWRETDR